MIACLVGVPQLIRTRVAIELFFPADDAGDQMLQASIAVPF